MIGVRRRRFPICKGGGNGYWERRACSDPAFVILIPTLLQIRRLLHAYHAKLWLQSDGFHVSYNNCGFPLGDDRTYPYPDNTF